MKKNWRRDGLILAACLVLATGISQPVARADQKAAIAQAAFDEGMNLAKQGKYAEACPKLEESYKLDEQIGTLFYLADCQEHLELRASAWANFTAAADKATAINKLAHAAEARARADALKVRLNKLLIVLPDELRKADGFQLRDGDIVLGPSQLGAAFPIDNGTHEIKVSATGRRTWSTTVKIAGEGSTITVSVPVLQEEPIVGPVVTAAPSVTAVAAPPPPEAGWSTGRKVAVGLGAVGVAGLVVGGIFGGLVADKVGTANGLCTPGTGGAPDGCSPEGARLRDEANSFANVANIGVLGGAALVAAGVVVWLVAPATENPAKAKTKTKTNRGVAVVAAPQGTMIQVRGEW